MSVRVASDRRQRRRPIAGFVVVAFYVTTILPITTGSSTPQIEVAQGTTETDRPYNKNAINRVIRIDTVSSTLSKTKRKSIDELGIPKPAKTYFEGRANPENRVTLGGLLAQNPRLKSLDMFQHDTNDTVIDITSPNLERENIQNSEAKMEDVIQQRLVQMASAPKSHLHTVEELQRTYDALLPKITSPNIDNFDELYRLFNSTYYHLARRENTTNDPVPYSSYKEIRKAGASYRFHHDNKANFAARKGFMHRLHSAKAERLSMLDSNRVTNKEKHVKLSSANGAKGRAFNQFWPIKESMEEESKYDPDPKVNVTAPRRFAPRSPSGSGEDPIEVNNTARMLIEQNEPETTTTRSYTTSTLPTTTTTFFVAVQDDSTIKNDRLFRKWPQNGSQKINIDTSANGFEFDNSLLPTVTQSSTLTTTIAESPAMSIVEHYAIERKNFTATNKTSNFEESSEPERLIPFPPIMPGGQFYVNQHVSYGHFGRYAEARNNVVYDPNVLQSRYGFNGILPGSLGNTFDNAQPSGSHDSDPSTPSPHLAPPDGALVSQFDDMHLTDTNPLSADLFSVGSILEHTNNQEFQRPKAMTFGVQNLPVTSHQLPMNNGGLTEHPIIFNHGPTIFTIPPIQKLGLAKAVPIRLKSFSSVTVGNQTQIDTLIRSPYEDSQMKKSHGKINGLLAAVNITDSRKKILLGRLNSAPPSDNSRRTDAKLHSGGNTGEQTLVRVAANADGNPLNWRPVSDGADRNAFEPKASTSTPPSIRPEPLSQFVPAFRQSSAPTSFTASEIESVNTFDEKTTTRCYAADHLFDSNDYSLTHVSARLVPAIQKCFRRAKNCVLQEAHPLERRINFSEEQCILFCGSHSYCISITYSPAMQICDIFNVRNGTGAAKLYQHKDFRYYELRRKTNLYDEENGRNNDCWKVIIKRSLRKTTTIRPNESTSPRNAHQSNETPPADNDVSLSSVPRDSCAGERDTIVFKSTGYRLLNSDDHLLTRANSTSDEPANEASMYLDKPLQQMSSETECIFSCLINLARGTTPYECMAATYNTNEASCSLYSTGDNLNGNIHLVPDADHNHYEKGCITMDLVELCKGYPIIRHAQKTLLGFAMKSQFATSFVECIEMCFIDRQRAHQQNAHSLKNRRYCKSIMYFYEETSNKNCILNSENRESAPAFFVDENEALVDYASFESCYEVHNNVENHNSPLNINVNAVAFADFSDPLTLNGLANERRRSQPTYLYTVDSDTGAHLIANSKRRPTADRPIWQLRFPMVERNWAEKHYADSEGSLFSEDRQIELAEPPRAKAPQIHIHRLGEKQNHKGADSNNSKNAHGFMINT